MGLQWRLFIHPFIHSFDTSNLKEIDTITAMERFVGIGEISWGAYGGGCGSMLADRMLLVLHG